MGWIAETLFLNRVFTDNQRKIKNKTNILQCLFELKLEFQIVIRSAHTVNLSVYHVYPKYIRNKYGFLFLKMMFIITFENGMNKRDLFFNELIRIKM